MEIIMPISTNNEYSNINTRFLKIKKASERRDKERGLGEEKSNN
jgi:hypothetical protein